METVHCSTSIEQEHALTAILGERAYQDAKWGTIEERPKQVGAWMTLMRKLLRDAEDACATSDNDQGALGELRKVVAVGLACFEQHGVPVRDVDSAVVAATPTGSVRNPRLEGYTDDAIIIMWNDMTSDNEHAYADTSVNPIVIFTDDDLYSEAMARNLPIIPF